jgi:hypothetical protein
MDDDVLHFMVWLKTEYEQSFFCRDFDFLLALSTDETFL